MSPPLPERMARMEAQLEHQAEKFEEFRDEMRAAVAKLVQGQTETKEILTQAKGGWRVLVGIGGAAGLIGAAIMWALNALSPLISMLPR